MAMIQVTDLTFSYEGSFDNIFEKVSFVIDTDWKLGFIGRNGRGKTTFLNLLLKKFVYQGTILSNVIFEYFPYEGINKAKNTMNIVEEIVPEYEFWKLCRELSLLGVSEDVLFRPFQTLSDGEQTKVLLGILFMKENHFLLIDEPTNHLDIDARKKVSAYLNSKKGFILVSHDRAFLDGCVDHILSINKTNIQIQKGNYSSWEENFKKEEQFEFAENNKLKAQIKQLAEGVKQTKDWSDAVEKTKIGNHSGDRGYIGHKAAKMMKRSKSIENRQERALEEKRKLLKNVEKADKLMMQPILYPVNPLIRVNDVSIFFQGEQDLSERKNVCNSITFQVEQGDRIVLMGKNGCGKSSLIQLILGKTISYTGKIEKGKELKFSYVPQSTKGLQGDLKKFVEENGIDETIFKTVLRKLDFTKEQFDKKIEDYSEGQKKKVLLARSLSAPAHIYVWDEPLNYIDMLSRIQLEELILEYQPTMILVEHDKAFIESVGTKWIDFTVNVQSPAKKRPDFAGKASFGVSTRVL